MPVTIRRIVRPRRKPGERANLSLEKILVAALDVLDATGLQDFSARTVAKKLGVSPAAIYAHFEGGLGGLKAAMVDVTLRDVARPYGPNDTPAGYVRDIFLRLLKAIHGKRPLAQLVAVELSADYLVCPIFVERLLAAALGSGKSTPNPARALDLVLAMLLGMIMVEAEVPVERGPVIRASNFSSRMKTLPPNEVPTLLANRVDLTGQIGRRLVSSPKILLRTVHWYAEPVIAALELKEGAQRPY
jgi:TetR/AcrR family transcriptional regulator, tetracycline repressor protein